MEKIKLSASKLKTLQSCSYLYHAKYVLRLPDSTNSGAARGFTIHSILEHLMNPKHRGHYHVILNSMEFPPAIKRLIRMHAKKLNVNTGEDLKMIYDMIRVAVNYDFFCVGSEKVLSEDEFKIESEKYIINGFIDQTAFYPAKTILIRDWKSSKQKYSTDEMESNLQALMYSLACYKKYGHIPEVQFLFLKFPKNPIQFFQKCTERQLKGFEYYLESVADFLRNFDEKKAKSDLAADHMGRRWLCGKHGEKEDGSKKFICQYREPFEYFAIKDKLNRVIKTSLTNDLVAKKDERIEKMSYKGCVAYHNKEVKPAEAFDF